MENKYEKALYKIGKCYVASEGSQLFSSDNYGEEFDLLAEAIEKADKYDELAIELVNRDMDCFISKRINDYNEALLDILKNKKVDVDYLRYCLGHEYDVKYYNSRIGSNLTQEEYELLKGWLNNEV